MKRFGFLGLMTPFAFLLGCKPASDANIPDVSNIDVDIHITRFEQELLGDTTIDAIRLQKLTDENPAFSKVFFDFVMPKTDDLIATNDPEARLQVIQSWIRHPRTQWLYDTVQQILPDLRPLEKELSKAFSYAKYYFPEKETPKIYSTISDFGYFPFIYAEDSLKDGIGISLEMFLGEEFPYLQYNGLNNAFSEYLTRSYNKEHITRRTMEVWVDDLMGQPSGNRMIDYMIHNGKKLFILKALMPEAPDSVIMDYSAPKLQWAIDNERNIWTTFTTNNLLYETSFNKIQKLIGPSPSSPGMPAQSPGNTGSWLGWQIIKVYMAKHPEMSLKDLVGQKDTQKVMDESGYKPPR
ncbi:MAG: hypothetical protein M3R25_08760 [Bacteroidota bacterium]|nr:hypothetical protein [Bacteroidota bacterium]